MVSVIATMYAMGLIFCPCFRFSTHADLRHSPCQPKKSSRERFVQYPPFQPHRINPLEYRYIQRFRAPSRFRGEPAYFLTNVASALVFLENLRPNQLSIDPILFAKYVIQYESVLIVISSHIDVLKRTNRQIWPARVQYQ